MKCKENEQNSLIIYKKYDIMQDDYKSRWSKK